MEHNLKIKSKYFQDIRSGIKTFDVRFNDRNYQIGDVLHLRELITTNRYYYGTRYTGEIEHRKISYILDDPDYCKDGFVILGLTAVNK